MAFLGDAFDFMDGARMTGITDPRRDSGASPDGVVTAHLVTVPEDEHSVTEERFTLAHLPLALVGFHGNNPDGSEWFVTFQAAEPAAALGACGEHADTSRLLSAGLRRALTFNPRAILFEELALTVEELCDIYADEDVSPDAVATWTAGDLVRGLIAELSGATLASLATGYAAGCAFPSTQHDCRGDVFADVFANWAAGSSLALDEPSG